ncbi:reverse transcriptase domain-containing protein [Tanacetum coccineum]
MYVCSRFGSPEPRRGRFESPKKKGSERKTVFKRLEKVARKTLKVATKVLVQKKQNPLITKGRPRRKRRICQKVKSAAKTERWAMPTWCYMFNSTLTGNARVWFDDLPKETINSYDDLKKAFLENYLQQKKCIKDPVEIYNIRQRDRESMEEFVRRYKLECRDVKGASKCMKSVDEMMRVTIVFLRGKVAASNRERKKSFPSWKQQEANQKQNFKKGGFRNQQRSERKQDHFALLTKTPKENFALDKGKFKTPPPMTTLVEKRNANKLCEFHGEVGYNTDECMYLRKHIKEMLKAGKLSHWIKEIKQNNRKEQSKVTKKGEIAGKDKAMAILMVQPWERVARQIITQSFSPNSEIFFPPLGEDEGTKGPMIIEAEIGGHCMHRHHPRTMELLRVRKLQAVPSTVHGMLKIPVEGGVITLKSSRLVLLECAMVSGTERTLPANESTVEERIKVAINPEYPEQTIMIGSTLTEEGRNKLCSLLQRNLDVFA